MLEATRNHQPKKFATGLTKMCTTCSTQFSPRNDAFRVISGPKLVQRERRLRLRLNVCPKTPIEKGFCYTSTMIRFFGKARFLLDIVHVELPLAQIGGRTLVLTLWTVRCLCLDELTPSFVEPQEVRLRGYFCCIYTSRMNLSANFSEFGNASFIANKVLAVSNTTVHTLPGAAANPYAPYTLGQIRKSYYFQFILYPILLLCCTVGNVLNLVVLGKTKKKGSTNAYMMTVAIANLFVL